MTTDFPSLVQQLIKSVRLTTSEMMRSYTCVFRMWSKMPTFTHNRTNRVIKNATIMNIIHNTNVYM